MTKSPLEVSATIALFKKRLADSGLELEDQALLNMAREAINTRVTQEFSQLVLHWDLKTLCRLLEEPKPDTVAHVLTTTKKRVPRPTK